MSLSLLTCKFFGHPANAKFNSAEDADSYPETGADEKREGAFCVWSHKEIQSVLASQPAPSQVGPDVTVSDIVCYHFDIRPSGNVDPYQVRLFLFMEGARYHRAHPSVPSSRCKSRDRRWSVNEPKDIQSVDVSSPDHWWPKEREEKEQVFIGPAVFILPDICSRHGR